MSGIEKLYLEYMAVAFSAFWVIVWGYTYRTHKKAMQLESEIRILQKYFGLENPVVAAAPEEPSIPGPSV